MNLGSHTSDLGESHGARQKEIKRITSNLPEVYNKYFFTMGNDQNSKVKIEGSNDPLSKTVTPKHLGLNKGFSLNQTQKHSIRAVDHVAATNENDILNATETQKNKNLK